MKPFPSTRNFYQIGQFHRYLTVSFILQPCHAFRPVKKVSWRTCLKETESVFKNILGRIYIKVSNYIQHFNMYTMG
jgi:hypothetical protein